MWACRRLSAQPPGAAARCPARRGFPIDKYRKDQFGLVAFFWAIGVHLGRHQVTQNDYTPVSLGAGGWRRAAQATGGGALASPSSPLAAGMRLAFAAGVAAAGVCRVRRSRVRWMARCSTTLSTSGELAFAFGVLRARLAHALAATLESGPAAFHDGARARPCPPSSRRCVSRFPTTQPASRGRRSACCAAALLRCDDAARLPSSESRLSLPHPHRPARPPRTSRPSSSPPPAPPVGAGTR